jgi:radical SAM superfamily enzyme YgiQ (UPF0313 family)
MPYLAAFFPPEWEVFHADEACDAIDFGGEYDLVMLTFHTTCAEHAYAIAARFRSRGIVVAVGGPHVTLVPDEAQARADVIFVGEGEATLPRFLADFERGAFLPRYDCAAPPPLGGIPFSRKDLFHRRDHSAGILIATRGCPNSCEFCAISVMYRGAFRRRPIAEVAEEFASFRGRVIIFWDDNVAADMEYAKELFRAIAPYKKWWSCQASVAAGEDEEFLRLAALSGCKQLFIGFESVSQRSLDGADKSFNRVERYKKVVRAINAHGIAVQAGLVFGFDGDTPEIFGDTIAFLEDAGVQNATFNILTPYPGTPLFARLEREGRILTREWARYNARTDVVFAPVGMTAERLLAGFGEVNRRFYSPKSIFRRLRRAPVGLFWTLPLNLIYMFRLRRI